MASIPLSCSAHRLECAAHEPVCERLPSFVARHHICLFLASSCLFLAPVTAPFSLAPPRCLVLAPPRCARRPSYSPALLERHPPLARLVGAGAVLSGRVAVGADDRFGGVQPVDEAAGELAPGLGEVRAELLCGLALVLNSIDMCSSTSKRSACPARLLPLILPFHDASQRCNASHRPTSLAPPRPPPRCARRRARTHQPRHGSQAGDTSS